MVENRKVFKLDQNKARMTKQRLQEESQKGLLPMWKIPEGESRIRILPPWSEAGDVAYECRSHWRIPPKDRMVNCLTVINKECPLCDLVSELKARGKADMANKFAARKSIYYNVIVRGEEEKGVQIMRSGVMLYQNILSYLYDEEYGNITDIDEGRDLTIERTGQGATDTRYDLKVSPKVSPLSTDKAKAQKWINSMYLLDEIMDFKPAYELSGIVNSITGGRTTVVEEEPELIESNSSEDDENEDDEVDELDSKRQKLMEELKGLV